MHACSTLSFTEVLLWAGNAVWAVATHPKHKHKPGNPFTLPLLANQLLLYNVAYYKGNPSVVTPWSNTDTPQLRTPYFGLLCRHGRHLLPCTLPPLICAYLTTKIGALYSWSIQWNLSKPDTTGAEESVLNSEVSSFQRLSSMNLRPKNCPVNEGVLNSGVRFHCGPGSFLSHVCT